MTYNKVPEEYQDVVGSEIIKSNLEEKMSNLKLKNIAGAVVSAVLSAVLMYVSNLTDVATFSSHTVVSTVIIVAASSLLKALTTSSEGKFVGVQVK